MKRMSETWSRSDVRPVAAVLFLMAGLTISAPPAQASEPTPVASAERVWRDANDQPLPFAGDSAVGELMLTSRVVERKKTKHGKFGVQKLRLEQDGIVVHAACRTWAQVRQKARLDGRTVRHFRDHFIHEPAAYALSELLGLHMVPPAVLRRVDGKDASVQIWVEGAMPAIERQEKNLQPPNPLQYSLQLQQMYVFDNLINNMDRNMGNLLIDRDWRIWLIDHTRSFIRDWNLPTPDRVDRIGRRFWERLRSVSDDDLQEALKPYLEAPERWAVLKRRETLVELIEERIEEKGADRVLFDDAPAPAPVPSPALIATR